MSEEQKQFLKEFRLTLLKWGIGFALTLGLTLVAFFFNTNHSINRLNERQTESIECQQKHEKALIQLNLNKVNRSEHREDIREVKDALIRIEQKIDRRW